MASKKGLKKINADINKRLGSFDLFRNKCIKTGVMYEILNVLSEYMGVKNVIKQGSFWAHFRQAISVQS